MEEILNTENEYGRDFFDVTLDKIKKTSVGKKAMNELNSLYSATFYQSLILYKFLIFLAIYLMAIPINETNQTSIFLAYFTILVAFGDTSLSIFTFLKPSKVLVKLELVVSIAKSLLVLILLSIRSFRFGFVFFITSLIFVKLVICFDFALFLVSEITEKFKKLASELSAGNGTTKTWTFKA